MNTSTLGDVLSGNKPIKVEIGLDTKNIAIIGVVLFVLVLVVGIAIKKI